MDKKRILLVDDEDGIQLLYRGEFEDEGYLVDSARNGEEALARFRANPPDLVLLDINMPGLNGIEVLRQMKELRAEASRRRTRAYVRITGRTVSASTRAVLPLPTGCFPVESAVQPWLSAEAAASSTARWRAAFWPGPTRAASVTNTVILTMFAGAMPCAARMAPRFASAWSNWAKCSA